MWPHPCSSACAAGAHGAGGSIDALPNSAQGGGGAAGGDVRVRADAIGEVRALRCELGQEAAGGTRGDAVARGARSSSARHAVAGLRPAPVPVYVLHFMIEGDGMWPSA